MGVTSPEAELRRLLEIMAALRTKEAAPAMKVMGPRADVSDHRALHNRGGV